MCWRCGVAAAQLSYPRTDRIRKRFVIRRLLELLFCTAMIIFIAEQVSRADHARARVCVWCLSRLVRSTSTRLFATRSTTWTATACWASAATCTCWSASSSWRCPTGSCGCLGYGWPRRERCHSERCCRRPQFYAIFHSYLNLTGELLRFGDRLFYRDWW
jgi:hypothetical protein